MWAKVPEKKSTTFLLIQIAPGLNYGWDCREGDIACPGCGNTKCSGLNFTEPVYWYGPGPGLSVTGGYVLEGEYYKAFKGQYIFADFVRDEMRTLQINPSRSVTVSEGTSAPNISTFGKDERGRVYAANYSGIIYQVIETGLLSKELITVNIKRHERQMLLEWETGFELQVSHFEVERSFANEPFKQIGVVPALMNSSDGNTYEFVDAVTTPGHYMYRLKSIDPDGSLSYSMTLNAAVTPETELTLMPNPANDRVVVSITGSGDRGTLQIISLDGSILKQVIIPNSNDVPLDLNVSDLERGLHLVQFTI